MSLCMKCSTPKKLEIPTKTHLVTNNKVTCREAGRYKLEWNNAANVVKRKNEMSYQFSSTSQPKRKNGDMKLKMSPTPKPRNKIKKKQGKK